jgi:hypothetical protein
MKSNGVMEFSRKWKFHFPNGQEVNVHLKPEVGPRRSGCSSMEDGQGVYVHLKPGEEMRMKGIRWLIVVPFLGMLGGIPFANRVTPYVLGMPFLLFWVVLWVVLTSLILWVVYRFDPEAREEEGK